MAKKTSEGQYVNASVFGPEFVAEYKRLKALKVELLQPYFKAWQALEGRLEAPDGKTVKLTAGFGDTIKMAAVDAASVSGAKSGDKPGDQAAVAALGIMVKTQAKASDADSLEIPAELKRKKK